MKKKIQITFLVVLVSYLAILSSGSYVSVYYTYFAIPALATLGLFGFGSFRSINYSAKVVFWISLALTVLTLLSVPYVGVYLVYFTAPFMVISGIIMVFSK